MGLESTVKAMSLRLDKETLAGRLRDFAPDSYVYIYGIMKGIAIGVGAVVVLTFPLDLRSASHFALWIAAFSAVLVTHTTAARGILLARYRYNLLDTVVPLIIGTLECLLFAVLQWDEIDPDRWRCWYLLIALHALGAFTLLTNRLALTKTGDVDNDLHELIACCRRWFRVDKWCALAFSLVFVAVWYFEIPEKSATIVPRCWVDVAFAAIVVLVHTGVAIKADSQRQRIVHFVAELTLDRVRKKKL